MKKWSFLLMAALLMIGGLIGCSQDQQGVENAPGSEQQGVSIDPPQSEQQMGTKNESMPTTGTEGDSITTDPSATGTENGADSSGSSSTDSETDTTNSSEGSTTDGEATTETQGQ